jgi:hypothetical protein
MDGGRLIHAVTDERKNIAWYGQGQPSFIQVRKDERKSQRFGRRLAPMELLQ